MSFDRFKLRCNIFARHGARSRALGRERLCTLARVALIQDEYGGVINEIYTSLESLHQRYPENPCPHPLALISQPPGAKRSSTTYGTVADRFCASSAAGPTTVGPVAQPLRLRGVRCMFQ